jgi:hypothetical protein
MEPNNHHNDIREKIEHAIRDGVVKMRPRWQFITRTILFIVGMVLVGLTLLFVASFIVFNLRQNGTWYIPSFGMRALGIFLMAMPWLLIMGAATFIIILQILVKRYAFGYGRPLMYSALGIIVLALVGGILLARTPLHRGLFEQAESDGLPFAGTFYLHFGENNFDQITVGAIQTITPPTFVILAPNNELYTVVVTPTTQTPFGAHFDTDDIVVVLGARNDHTIQALGMRTIDERPVRHLHMMNQGILQPLTR